MRFTFLFSISFLQIKFWLEFNFGHDYEEDPSENGTLHLNMIVFSEPSYISDLPRGPLFFSASSPCLKKFLVKVCHWKSSILVCLSVPYSCSGNIFSLCMKFGVDRVFLPAYRLCLSRLSIAVLDADRPALFSQSALPFLWVLLFIFSKLLNLGNLKYI